MDTALPSELSERPILFVGEAVSLAHIGRPAQLAQWSRAAGCSVAFACGERYAFVARDTGFEPLPLPTIEPETFYGRLGRGIFFYTSRELEAYVEAECELLRRVRPALVVSDFRLSLAISAELMNVPLVSMINAYWSPAAPGNFPLPRNGVAQLLPDGIWQSLSNQIRSVVLRTFAAPLNRVRREHGLAPLDDFRKHYCAGDACAYLDLPEFAPVNPLPRGHFYLGPLAWSPAAEPPRWAELGRTRKLAYVTLGSTGNRKQLADVLRSLCELDLDIAVSGVSDREMTELCPAIKGLESRCRSAPLVCPDEILKRCVLTVCHGGSGTIYQSLGAGVPLLCLASNPDQGLASRCAANSGCAIALESVDSTPTKIKSAVQELLTKSALTEAARSMALLLRTTSARQRWLDFLSGFALPKLSEVALPAV